MCSVTCRSGAVPIPTDQFSRPLMAPDGKPHENFDRTGSAAVMKLVCPGDSSSDGSLSPDGSWIDTSSEGEDSEYGEDEEAAAATTTTIVES